MSDETVREHLTAFGLSETEVAVYLGVLRAGSATTGEIAGVADVSQGYVYEVVGTLAERGLVAIDESTTPTTIRARPAAEALADLDERLGELETAIKRTRASSEPAGFEIVHSRQTVRKRALAAVETAERELVLAIPAPEFDHFADALAGATDRGVVVYLLLSAPDPAGAVAELDDPGRYASVLRTWATTPPVFVVAEETRGVMGSHGVLSGRHGEESALSFTQSGVASGFFGNLVSNVWPMGTTCYRADPDPLPATYDYFRTAVTNAALHRAAGRDLAADLTVADVETGEQRSFEGVPIVDIRQSLVGESTADFPIENSLVFEHEGERLSVGHPGGEIDPFLEDFAADSVTLRGQ